jgi:hypothetical protein
MRRLIASTFTSLDGVMQAPARHPRFHAGRSLRALGSPLKRRPLGLVPSVIADA